MRPTLAIGTFVMTLSLTIVPAWVWASESLTVLKVYRSHKKLLVDEGRSAGLSPGKTVMLRLESGEEVRGRVYQATDSKAYVDVAVADIVLFQDKTSVEFTVPGGRTSDRGERSTAPARGAAPQTKAIQGLLGMASSPSGSKALFGADFVLPLGKSGFTLAPGVTYWGTSGGDYEGYSFAFMTLDAGLAYHLALGRNLDLEAGGRAGLASISVTYDEAQVAVGQELSAGTTQFVITPSAALHYAINRKISLGAELRLPMTAETADFSGKLTYVLASLRFAL